MSQIIVEWLATLSDVLLLIWFVPKCLGISIKEKPWSLIWTVVQLTFQLLADKYLGDNAIVYIIGVFIVSSCFAVTLSFNNMRWAFFSSSVYVIALMLVNTFVYALLSGIFDSPLIIDGSISPYPRLIYVLTCKIIQFAFYQIILLVFKKNHELDLLNCLLSLAFSIATSAGLSVIMRVSISYYEEFGFSLALLAVILVFLNMVLFVMIRQIQKLIENKYALRFMEEKIASDKTRIEEVEKIWERIRITKHDLKNHFLVLKGFFETGDTTSGLSYLAKMNDSVEAIGNMIHSGNTVIDYLINLKFAGLTDIQVLISGYVGNYNDINNVDMACILGNILDNAIEAQKSVVGIKRIELLFLKQNSNRFIICKNTINESVLKNNRQLKSTKESPDMHGFGHQIIETTVSKYHGWVDYFEENDMFGIQIMLPESDNIETA